jgi:PAS domain-containing protein
MDSTGDPFSLIQAVTACGVIVWDAADEVIVAANETAAQILALPLRTLLHPAGDRCQFRLLRADGTTLPWEERPSAVAVRTREAQRKVLVGVVSAGGRRCYVHVDAVPIRRDDGMITGVVVSFVEATERAPNGSGPGNTPA